MLVLAPKEMSRHMQNIYGSESKSTLRKPQDSLPPSKLGKRQRDEEDLDHPDPKRKRQARQE